jgi:hypothetical protein
VRLYCSENRLNCCGVSNVKDDDDDDDDDSVQFNGIHFNSTHVY